MSFQRNSVFPGLRPARVIVGAIALVLGCTNVTAAARAADYLEPPLFAERVAAGELPPVAARLPDMPSVAAIDGPGREPGQYGGTLRMLAPTARDIRLLAVYGYARLVAYNEQLELVPDLLEAVEVKEGRRFTFRLRANHRWSDGHPFTTEDFRYWWEDVAGNRTLSPAGPPRELAPDGKLPQFEVIDDRTVRFTWPAPNPYFLPALAGAAPLFIYRPAHYLKQFHVRYAAPEALARAVSEARTHNWAALHNRYDNLYKFDNPALPTLQPWRNTTASPATRFVAERNPYFHRVDEAGHQLPYIDRVIVTISEGNLIPPRTSAGEADLQARGLSFKDITFLKENEERSGYDTLLWPTARGAHRALFPNLNNGDPAFRKLFRDVRFRRALSLAIDRELINEALYFGVALQANNGVLPQSPLYDPEVASEWTTFDPARASALLDELGLDKRGGDGIRLLPDGRPLNLIVESAGEGSEESDLLELVGTTWAEVGIKLFIKPQQRANFRNRVFSGATQVSIWSGFENGIPTAEMSPDELAPTSQQQYQWPKWGQYYETRGASGEAPDLEAATHLLALNAAWRVATEQSERAKIWREMLSIHAEQQFAISLISGVLQPVVVRRGLMNVPTDAVYNWDPGAHFGIYRPDTFWFAGDDAAGKE
ncbi:ABC transporter substrate-binding protein [Oceanibacterium hippocampi]|uniref:Putative ABC transporter-binding protein n=1 Tax=Oceanibacterium hippocampi TaxID=745714 RepID=A0A1Y5RLF4_9PROT|nr:ABC transporter substrate-binding protein [Oceanibacterium hippocampi]SLN20058.1 putative ABC transporter-binding protein precursor [Oceanibacterium hippocampi]